MIGFIIKKRFDFDILLITYYFVSGFYGFWFLLFRVSRWFTKAEISTSNLKSNLII